MVCAYDGTITTGSMIMVLWDDVGRAVQPADILRLSFGYASLNKRHLTLYIGKFGRIEKLGRCVTLMLMVMIQIHHVV